MDVKERVLDAIQMLTANAVKKAGYDKTIQAQVVSCEDATIGKYKCRYQDALIYAYTDNAEITYTNGSYVYILVPNGDMGKEKTILGTTKKLGINYISQAQGDQAYNFVGNNCVSSNDGIIYLDTNNIDYRYILYRYDKESDIELDVQALNQYIKQSSSLIAGAAFKTTILPEKQYRGHYGIVYNLRFLDNTSNQQVIRSYTIDEDNMIGNPYRLEHPTRQYQIFDIDGNGFIRVESIEIFNKDFPKAEGNVIGKLSNGDIEITNLELNGAIRMSESEVNGVAISFYTPQGTFFNDFSKEGDYRTVVAQVRVKGKLVSSVQNIPFYWGKENVGITSRSEYYNKHLGRGWQCLNDRNIISEATPTTDPIIEWIPAADTYILKLEEATARDNRFKVAIIYDGTVISKQIDIQNLGVAAPELTIESSGGTKFYYDIGHPTLTCKVNGAEIEDYKYYWGYEDNTGIFYELPETVQQNKDYDKAVNDLKELNDAIAAGTDFPNEKSDLLEEYEINLKAFDFIQRVKKNKVYDVQINNITSFGTFKCSVYNDKDVYLGTTSITLTNSLQGESLYSLVINNGAVTFQYNENGVAPNSKSLDVQQEIQALSFTIYDNLGQPIDSSIISNSNNCKIRWAFPIKGSMLEQQEGKNGTNSGTDATQTYRYYDNITTLFYGIKQKYDIKRQRNQIKLTVDYKGMNLTAETDFTFVKQGEPGTNGTEYILKLVPNVIKGSEIPVYPIITKIGNSSNYLLNYRIPEENCNYDGIKENESIIFPAQIQEDGYQFFKAQLWHSGSLIWEGFSNGDAATDGRKPSLVDWGILRNKYNTKRTTTSSTEIWDESLFEEVNNSEGFFKYSGINGNSKAAFTLPFANIIKCSVSWQGKTYYGTIPVITGWIANLNYRIKLKDYTGFRYVIYTSDGVAPQYDNTHPFEFICEEKINGFWEDISKVSGSKKVTYKTRVVGNYLLTNAENTNTKKDSNLLKILDSETYNCDVNQIMVKPADRYDGVSVNNAVCCIFESENRDVASLNIPIHFLLNKYGLAHINAWDGNSVQVNQDGGFILAPQMGMGVKDNNNNFTGVLAGEVRTPGKQNPDIGLLGFNKGERTIFLNSENGSALFGKTGAAQIIIDPNTSQGMIYSGNFWKSYNIQTGLPTNYSYRDPKSHKPKDNCNQQGLLINLSEPEIYFGNGNFYVTKDGYMHAAGGGDIAGWSINENTLVGQREVSVGNRKVIYKITLDSSGKIYSNDHNALTNTSEGFYLSQDGLSIGNQFRVTPDGTLRVGPGSVNGKDTRHWTIGTTKDTKGNVVGGYIGYKTDKFTVDANGGSVRNGVYLGTDGITVGRWFSVDAEQGFLISKSGEIGGWKIGASYLASKNYDPENSNNKEYIKLNTNGTIQANYKENESGWRIDRSGNAYFNNLTANKTGKIGGWIINQNTLTSIDGKLTLYASGSIQGDGWILNANTLQAHNTNGTLKIDLVGGGNLVSGAGSIGSSGGYFGSSNSGSAGITYDKSNVTIKGKTVKIESGVSIGDYFTVNRSGLQGNSKNGFIYLDASTGMVNASIIRGASFQASQGDNDYKSGRTGVITFSDGATITVTCGLITRVTKGNGSGSTTWSGN